MNAMMNLNQMQCERGTEWVWGMQNGERVRIGYVCNPVVLVDESQLDKSVPIELWHCGDGFPWHHPFVVDALKAAGYTVEGPNGPHPIKGIHGRVVSMDGGCFVDPR